jgi:hypothetical protein
MVPNLFASQTVFGEGVVGDRAGAGRVLGPSSLPARRRAVAPAVSGPAFAPQTVPYRPSCNRLS